MSDDDDWDEEDAAEEARYRESLERAMTLPPSCLAAFTATRIAVPADVAVGGHGGGGSEFRLACASCGAAQHSVLGYWWLNTHYNKKFFSDPLALRCVSCGQTDEVFDEGRHGYNAVVCGDQPLHRRGENLPAEQSTYACECGATAFEVTTSFEQGGDALNDSTLSAGGVAGEDLHGREQDTFSWFTLAGRCVACGKAQTITEFECA